MFSLLKNTQATIVEKNVIPICNNSLIFGNHLLQPLSWCIDDSYRKNNGITLHELSYIRNVQLAPCQKPLTIKIINIFLIDNH